MSGFLVLGLATLLDLL